MATRQAGPGGKRKGGERKAATSDPSEQSQARASDADADSAAESNGEAQVSILSVVEFNARVARKAYGLFEQRGRHEGHDIEDWLEAERLVKEELLDQTEAKPE